MKHLKTYEEGKTWLEDPLYQEGDYVELSEEAIKDNGLNDIFENIGIIIENVGIGQKQRVSNHMYDVNYLKDDFDFENLHSNYVPEEDIIRKLSEEEVKDIETLIETKKYNL